MSNVPKLRFKEFSENYNKYKFEDIFSFSTGKNIKQNEASPDYEIPCVRYGELYHMYGEVITKVINKTNLDKSELRFSKGTEILLPSAGEDPLDIGSASALKIPNVAIGRTINILSPLTDNIYLPEYVSYYINQKLKKKISTLAKGVSISNVYNSDLKTLTINLPPKQEQEKIASFLTSVDTKIEQLTKKEALLSSYKKGMMQKIFNQEIRFKADDGSEFCDWEEKKLSDIVDFIVDNRGKTPPISSDKIIPLIEVNAIGQKKVNYSKISKFVSENTFNTWFRKYLQNGDLLFSTVGQTGICSLYNDNKKAVIAQNIVGLRFNTEHSEFIYYMLTELNNHRKIKSIEMGAVQPSIKVSQLIELFFFIPNIQEQIKIANFLSSIDSKIEQVQKQLAYTKEFKKALLQQMFV